MALKRRLPGRSSEDLSAFLSPWLRLSSRSIHEIPLPKKKGQAKTLRRLLTSADADAISSGK